MRPFGILFVALVGIAACDNQKSDPALGPAAAESGNVTAERVTDGVRITNGSAATISYVVVNPEWLGLLASCRTAPCPTIAAGASAVVPEASIYGFSASAPRLVVKYWPENTSVEAPIEIEISM
jgi:hypothetical protein